MGFRKYGVLRGVLIEGRRDRNADRPHYRLNVHDKAGRRYDIAQNVQSADGSRVVYTVRRPFHYPGLTDRLLSLRSGFTRLWTAPGGLALDFVRASYFPFSRAVLRSLPFNREGPNNDLQDLIQSLASVDAGAIEVFAFGAYFHRGHGVHEVHMNQGNPKGSPWYEQNGTWQDGALFFHYPERQEFAALFTLFQTQRVPTDESGVPTADSRSVEEILRG